MLPGSASNDKNRSGVNRPIMRISYKNLLFTEFVWLMIKEHLLAYHRDGLSLFGICKTKLQTTLHWN